MRSIVLSLVMLMLFCSGKTLFAEENSSDVTSLIKVVKASDFVKPFKQYTFKPENIIDGKLSTCWQIPFQPKKQPWIEITFNGEVDIDQMDFANGFQHSDKEFGDLYKSNSRIKKAWLIFNGDSKNSLEVKFKDVKGYCGYVISKKNIRSVRIYIREVYAGSKWNDLSLSEMRIMGRATQAVSVNERRDFDFDRDIMIKYAITALEENDRLGKTRYIANYDTARPVCNSIIHNAKSGMYRLVVVCFPEKQQQGYASASLLVGDDGRVVQVLGSGWYAGTMEYVIQTSLATFDESAN